MFKAKEIMYSYSGVSVPVHFCSTQYNLALLCHHVVSFLLQVEALSESKREMKSAGTK